MIFGDSWFQYFYYKRLAEREKLEQDQQAIVDKQQALIDDVRDEAKRKNNRSS